MILLYLLAVPLFSDSNNYSDKNRLKGSSSPYLLQHADNPVHWLPWGARAFEEARRLDRPILVSIGYSTCHWCHVMEHESFEDPSTASIMNNYLITIKVDREQLPEVDAFYMEAASLMGGSTGWPLNVFIFPDGKPFYAGTYFPAEVLQQLIIRVNELWKTDRDKLRESGNALTDAVQNYSQRSAGSLSASGFTEKNRESVYEAYLSYIVSGFDEEYPGFPSSGGTQFPPTTMLSFLMEFSNKQAGEIAEKILETMQDSGLHDRVGGGFHRYTTDRIWHIPHFEKMLYDNAQLMGLYARASVVFKRDDFLQTANDIGDYLLRDMTVYNSAGDFSGFATAEDADDPNGEGAFYAWSPGELKQLLPNGTAEKLIGLWDLKELNGRLNREPVSGWIPYPLNNRNKELLNRIESEYKAVLFAARSKRPRPERDDKVLTDLNALTLEGFSILARVSGEPRFIDTVNKLSSFLIKRYNEEGIVRMPGIAPYISDYSFMILGLTAAYPILEKPGLIEIAIEISEKAEIALSTGLGSYYSSSKDSLNLPVRKVDSFDTQVPSGLNSMALGFSRLFGITGNISYKNRVEKILSSQKKLMLSYPSAYSTLLRANILLNRKWHIVLAGNPEKPEYKQMKNMLLSSLGSDYIIISTKNSENESWPLLRDRKKLADPQVLICNDKSCLLPAFSADELDRTLKEAGIIPVDW